MNKTLSTGLSLLVASVVITPHAMADMRESYNQQQSQQAEASNIKKKACESLLAKAQFVSTKNTNTRFVITEGGVTTVTDIGTNPAYPPGTWCNISRSNPLGKANYRNENGRRTASTCYIEDGKLVNYTNHHWDTIQRFVIGVPL